MTVDWDGQIRMDPSSPYAMQPLIEMKDRFDLSFACDYDRHGIVTKSEGLLPPNHRRKAEGRRQKGRGLRTCPMPLGLKPLTLVMKNKENMYFETQSALKYCVLVKSPDFSYGDT